MLCCPIRGIILLFAALMSIVDLMVPVFSYSRNIPKSLSNAQNSIFWNKHDASLYRYPTPSLHMTDVKYTHERILNAEEELELLWQATELRRLKKHEEELVLRDPKKLLPLLSIRSRTAGYGDDMDGYEAAINNGHEARERLVTCNMGLVRYCAKDIMKKQSPSKLGSLSREDLIQEGAIGLARAVDKYNIGIGGKFSTYSYYWIRAAMLRCIAERGEVLRVPEHVSTAVRKMIVAANKLGFCIDGDTIVKRVATSKEWKEAHAAKAVAEEAGLTDSQLRQAMKVQKRRKAGQISFEDWIRRGKDLQSDVELCLHNEETMFNAKKLEDEFSKYLRPKEMEALSLRYGLKIRKTENDKNNETRLRAIQNGKSGEAMSFKEVGRCMSVSAEYGRRLVHKALTKLRKAADDGQLEAAFLF